MTGIEVVVGADESIDQVLRRFKKRCNLSGLNREMRRHEFYEKPSVRARKKSATAQRKLKRKTKFSSTTRRESR